MIPILPGHQRISQRISGSADQWMREPADQRISPRIGGSADQRISPADQRIRGSVIIGSAEPADRGARGSTDQRITRRISGSADQSLDESAEPADQRISGSLGGSADQRISPWISGARGSTDQRITRRISRAGGSADQRITTTGSVQVRSQVFSTANMSHNRRVIRTRQPGFFFFFFFALASGTWCRRGQGLPSELSTLHAPLPNFAFTAIIAEHLFASHLLSLAPFSQPTQIIL